MSKIQGDFDNIFGKYKAKKIAIYGTGNNARLLLNNVLGYQFVTLVSKNNIGETICGKKVVSLQEAVSISEMLIIAATPTSTVIVYNRIKDQVPEDYPVYNMRGIHLSGADYYRKNPYWQSNEERLRMLIEEHSAISFDIFDTLITRIVFEPKDVFKLIEEKLEKSGIDIPFYEWRIRAEDKCNEKVTAPSIEYIYEIFGSQNNLPEDAVKTIMQLEYETELEVICPRIAMKEILEWTISLGKKVCLTSDMYFSKEEISKMLKSVGIHQNIPILVSSDYGKSKEEGSLYKVLCEEMSVLSILHIGDNYESDIKKAQEYGIKTFQVKRGFDLLAESSYNFLLDQIETEDDRRLLGRMIADFCNNPFELSNTRGKFCIDNYRKLAWPFVPITILFMSEIVKNAKKYDMLLFASRDGFFLNELYNIIYQKKLEELPQGKYFYVSRTAISSASIFSENDIKVLSSKIEEDLKLNLKQFLELQFHIQVSDEFDMTVGEAIARWGVSDLERKLKELENNILSISEQKRRGYLQYINKMGIGKKTKLAIIDIVTQGTPVFCLSNLLKKEIGLFALGTSWFPNKYISDESLVHSVYGNVYGKVENMTYSFSELDELHLFLEMIYSSTEGQLFEFTQEGEPLMVKGTEYNSFLLEKTQEQMKDIIESLEGNFYKKNISKEFALACMKLLYKKYSDVIEDIKAKFVFEDPYAYTLQNCNLFDIINN